MDAPSPLIEMESGSNLPKNALTSADAYAIALDGPTQASNEKIEAVHRQLLRCARRLIPRELHQRIDPEQVVQDVWAVLASKGLTVLCDPRPGSLSAWMHKAVRNRCVDLIRSHNALRHGDGRLPTSLSPQDSHDPAHNLPSPTPSPSSRIPRQELNHQAKRLLSPAQYDAWYQTIYLGRPDPAAAHALGCTESALRGLRARALQTLGEHLDWG